MGDLSPARVQPSRPFNCTGVDYAGPVHLHVGTARSKITCKVYIAVFVCLSTKAIHLEAVTNLTTKEAFLAALRRVIAWRSIPQQMYSDNGTNFRGVANQLRDLSKLLQSRKLSQEVQLYLSNNVWVEVHSNTCPTFWWPMGSHY
jgi:hypothetical protein